MNAQDTSLTVAGLNKSYGGIVRVIDDVDFALEAGTFFTLLGPSGCGKTTTLRCIAGLEQPQHGVIRVGKDAVFDSTRGVNVPLNKRNFGMVFQSYAIWPHLTVFENVAFPLRVSSDEKFDSGQVRKMVEAALSAVGLLSFAGRSATQLSGGQQQRVALARAIVRRPRLLLLDEPLSNLDAVLREEMRVELKRLQQEIGITTVYVTHDQTEALEMSDTIAVLNRGRLVQLGAPEDVYFRPRDAFVAGFMGSPNLLPGSLNDGAPEESTRPVALADGQSLTCHLPHATAEREVLVSIRPENIMLSAAGTAPRAGWNRLEGTVVTAGFLGQFVRYGVEVQGKRLQAMGPALQRLPRGAPVVLDFLPEHTLGLEKDSAAALAPAA